ncbi:DUF4914 family protein [Pelagicoccus sp. NFK12]|uniref:DUF4914 family protein n=1 Tax=Pelagicoccus enzymogenes TaxID=2773457 RepID=A0A927FFN1_9BACT|nr:DUF4914 family protein [Pelagicoccus enzymogenes]MBD5782523.1 DUF4914 family protein [Pelagicoccus enzymogenes]MDQ8199562.1 DUF4914 family protein [Pelagicoccus enzymogenes]
MKVENAPFTHPLINFELPSEVERILSEAPSVVVPETLADLRRLSLCDADEQGWHDVSYEVPGRGDVLEARVCRVSNGIAANYVDPYMRRRDPDCMVIGDARRTDKPTFEGRYGKPFDDLRGDTFDWLKTQPLAVFPFNAGLPGKGMDAIVVAPANAGFFALGLALLQGMIEPKDVPEGFSPKAVIYVAPPFRHTHFDGKQVVVHNRLDGMHELFSYNLYPGPSAKKGIYGVLLTLGEQEKWITMHCSTVEVVTPYDGRVVISHEGASGGGKSELLEQVHRQPDGSLLLGENLVTGDRRSISLPQACDLRPVTDDMALCHPSLDNGTGKLGLMDAEDAWFLRVNHIDRYGVDPNLESMCIHPSEDLLFLNIKAQPNSTALIWEHIEDEPGSPCPNPRVVVPRSAIPNIVDEAVEVDIRSFGVRCPPCTSDNPSYGIIGMFHVLPPALAWLWRLVAPRGHANPSIVDTGGMSSEGVGSYWPFATGRRVDQANLILQQIVNTPEVSYILMPNQHIGAWKVGFMPQWITREYLARRNGAKFSEKQVKASRCSLLGWNPDSIMVESRQIGTRYFNVEKQPEVGVEAYDQGAKILQDFFRSELANFDSPDLDPLGRKIIECCLNGGTVEDYDALLGNGSLSKR